MTISAPPVVLNVTVDPASVTPVGVVEDEASPLYGVPYRWSVTLDVPPTQHTHGYTDGAATPPIFGTYTGGHLKPGMWLLMETEEILRVASVSAQSDGSVTCVLEDPELYNYQTNNAVSFSGAGNGLVFALDGGGHPIVDPLTKGVYPASMPMDLLSRFRWRGYTQDGGAGGGGPTLDVALDSATVLSGVGTLNLTGNLLHVTADAEIDRVTLDIAGVRTIVPAASGSADPPYVGLTATASGELAVNDTGDVSLRRVAVAGGLGLVQTDTDLVVDASGLLTNIGGGVGLFAGYDRTQNRHRFRTLTGGAGVTITNTASDITIAIPGLVLSSVAPGTYNNANITVDAFGRVTLASDGVQPETVTGANLGGGAHVFAGKNETTFEFKTLKAGGFLALTDDGETITLAAAPTGVVADSYSAASFSVDQYGRITGASSNPIVSDIANAGADGINTGAILQGWTGRDALLRRIKVAGGLSLVQDDTDIIIDAANIAAGGINGVSVFANNAHLGDAVTAFNLSGDLVTTTVANGLASIAIQSHDFTLATGGLTLGAVTGLDVYGAEATIQNGKAVLTLAPPPAVIDVRRNNLSVAAATALNFTGTAVSVTNAGDGIATVSINLPENGSSGTVSSVDVQGGAGIDVASDAGGAVTTAGTFTVALQPSGVTGGNYVNPQLSVDDYGRIVAATDGSLNLPLVVSPGVGLSVTKLTGGGLTDYQVSLATNGVQHGTYPNATVTVDVYGRVIAIAPGQGLPGTVGTVNRVDAQGINGITVTGGPIETDGTLLIGLSDVAGLTEGTYANPIIVVDRQGRIRAIQNGSDPENPTSQPGIINSVNAIGYNGVTVTGGPIRSGDGVLSIGLGDTGVAAGPYRAPLITVDSQGRIITAKDIPVVTGARNSPAPSGSQGAVYAQRLGDELYFRRLVGLNGLRITQTADYLYLDAGAVGTVKSVTAWGGNGINVTGDTTITQTGAFGISLAEILPQSQVRYYDAPSFSVDRTGRITGLADRSRAVFTGWNEGGGGWNNAGVLHDVIQGPDRGQAMTFRRLYGSSEVRITESAGGVFFGFQFPDTGVVADTYPNATVTVDRTGRITAIRSNIVGEINKAANLGPLDPNTAHIYQGKNPSTTELYFRRVVGTGPVTVTQTSSDIQVGFQFPPSGTDTGIFDFPRVKVDASGRILEIAPLDPTPPTGVLPGGMEEGTFINPAVVKVGKDGRVRQLINGTGDGTPVILGETNHGENVGTGAKLYKAARPVAAGVEALQFRTVRGAGTATVSEDGDEIIVTVPAPDHLVQTVELTTSNNGVVITGGQNGVGGPITTEGRYNLALSATGVANGLYDTPTRLHVNAEGRITQIESLPYSAANRGSPKQENVGTFVIDRPGNGFSLDHQFQFRSLVAHGSVYVNEAGNDVHITGPAIGGTGDVTVVTTPSGFTIGANVTASTLGAATADSAEFPAGKVGSDLKFRRLVAGANLLIAQDADSVTLAVDPTSLLLNAPKGTVTSVAATGGNGITVTGSPITTAGALAIRLDNTGVAADTYTAPTSLTVDSTGRITAITQGSLPVETVVSAGAGDASVVKGKTDGTLFLRSFVGGSGIQVQEGSDTVTISATAALAQRVTSVALGSSDGEFVFSGQPVTSSGTIDINLKPVPDLAPGQYEYATVTVDGKGRVTAIEANIPTGTVSRVVFAGTDGVTVSGDTTITHAGGVAIGLADSGVAAGSYTLPSFYVNAKGLITSATTTPLENLGQVGAGVWNEDLTGKVALRRMVSGDGIAIVETDEQVVFSVVGVPFTVLKDDTEVLRSPTQMRFTGNVVLSETAGGLVTINVPATPAPPVRKDGATVVASPSAVNFTGNVTVTADGAGGATIAIPAPAQPANLGGGTVALYDTANKGFKTLAAGPNVAITESNDVITIAATAAGGGSSSGGGGGGTEYAVFQYTSGSSGTFNASDALASKTSGVSVAVTDPVNCIVEFTFTGYLFPPVAVAVMGQSYATNEFNYTNVSPSITGSRKIAGGGTAAVPTLMGGFTKMTLQLSQSFTGASASIGQRAKAIVMFKF